MIKDIYFKNRHKSEEKGRKNIYNDTNNQKKAGLAILISDTANFRTQYNV